MTPSPASTGSTNGYDRSVVQDRLELPLWDTRPPQPAPPYQARSKRRYLHATRKTKIANVTTTPPNRSLILLNPSLKQRLGTGRKPVHHATAGSRSTADDRAAGTASRRLTRAGGRRSSRRPPHRRRSGAALYFLQHYVFKGTVPDGVASLVYVAVPGVLAVAAGWLAPHQSRTPCRQSSVPRHAAVPELSSTVTVLPPDPPAAQP